MTVAEMHINFKFGGDKLAALNYPNFLPEEIDLLLNQSQDRITKQRYGLNNFKREGFEEIQKRTEDLKNIVVPASLTPLPYSAFNIDVNARFFTLPANYWFVIWEKVEISHTDCNDADTTTLVEVRPTQHVEFDKVIKDAFKKPDKTKVLRLMEQGQAEIVTDSSSTIVSYKMRYIKRPARISLTLATDCELSEHLHQEIVDEAIKIALEGIEAKRNQTFTPIIDSGKE